MKSARDGEKPAMNPNNYPSLEASKRLVEAGIVLETDCYYKLYNKRVCGVALAVDWLKQKRRMG